MQKFLAVLILLSAISFSQNSNQPTVSVKELPPEAIPAGTCKGSYSGYLEIPERGKMKDMNFTPQQIGDYVKKRLSAAYSLSLYSQASGRLFVIESCQPKKD